jgi:hypothetical protein
MSSQRTILPGDRVSYINDKLSGTVKRIIDKKQVLLLLDDGFEIPANINELVVTEKTGGDREKLESELSIIAEEVDKTDKMFFGAVTEDTGKGQLVKTYLVNTTHSLIKFALFNTTNGNYRGLFHGELEPSRALKLVEFMLAEATDYRNLVLQVISYAENPASLAVPLHVPFKIRPVALIKDQKIIPVLKQKGFLINLSDLEHSADADDKQKLLPKVIKPEPVPDIIDLHLEELTENPKGLMPHAALELQMKVFNNSLEKAIAQDMQHVTFIHGVGQGRLKGEIRKVLGLNPYIHRFEDGDPKKFGYGATKVFLKSR